MEDHAISADPGWQAWVFHARIDDAKEGGRRTMQWYVKVALSGMWYGYSQANSEQEAREQHEEDQRLMPYLARHYPGPYLVRATSPGDAPAQIRHLIEAIDQKDLDAFVKVLEKMSSPDTPDPLIEND